MFKWVFWKSEENQFSSSGNISVRHVVGVIIAQNSLHAEAGITVLVMLKTFYEKESRIRKRGSEGVIPFYKMPN